MEENGGGKAGQDPLYFFGLEGNESVTRPMGSSSSKILSEALSRLERCPLRWAQCNAHAAPSKKSVAEAAAVIK